MPRLTKIWTFLVSIASYQSLSWSRPSFEDHLLELSLSNHSCLLLECTTLVKLLLRWCGELTVQSHISLADKGDLAVGSSLRLKCLNHRLILKDQPLSRLFLSVIMEAWQLLWNWDVVWFFKLILKSSRKSNLCIQFCLWIFAKWLWEHISDCFMEVV